LYNLEATPAEGTSRRLARLDRDLYPNIKVANSSNPEQAPFYTNSTQLPVNFTSDIFEALELQDSLQTRYTGGTVLHFFLGESLPSSSAVRTLVRKIAENYHLPYFTITPTFSVCPKHGYIAGEHPYCPKCDEEIGYHPEPGLARTI
jgi:ribonucleoside-triphosphate reductase